MNVPPPPPLGIPSTSERPQLPLGWSEHVSELNYFYFYNPYTRESTYSRPSLSLGPPKGSSIDPKSGKLVMPELKEEHRERPKQKFTVDETHWLRIVTNRNNTFYLNRQSRVRTWQIPDEILSIENSRIDEERRIAFLKRKAEQEAEEQAEPAQADQAPAAVKKPKKKKPKIIQSLADIEDVELKDQLVEELAQEEQRLAKLDESTLTQPAQSGSLTSDEAKAMFKAMLAEKNISVMAPWDMELPKIVSDPRYLSIKSMAERKACFDEFCKDRMREKRAKKQSNGAQHADTAAEYRALLESEITSTRAHWEDFRQKFKKDNRFREFGHDDREREKAFKSWLRELGEVKRAEAQRLEDGLWELLHERHISADEPWERVKPALVGDPRYDAIKSSSTKEDIFKRFVKKRGAQSSQRKQADVIDDRKAKQERALASLNQRTQQVRRDQDKFNALADRSRAEAGAAEAEREFAALLIDAVRSHTDRWEDVEEDLARDERFHLPGLTSGMRHRLWTDHVAKLRHNRQDTLEALFQQHASRLDTSFEQVWPRIRDEQIVKRLDKSRDDIKRNYETWMTSRTAQAQQDLIKLLGESNYVEFWGRLRKEKEASQAEREVGFGNAEEDLEQTGDGPDIRQLSKQIDLREIAAVLKHDRRYQILDTMPDQRDEWIRGYLDNLTAQRMTVFQR